jgi:hypothetical protein
VANPGSKSPEMWALEARGTESKFSVLQTGSVHFNSQVLCHSQSFIFSKMKLANMGRNYDTMYHSLL